jgi:hypothetical protein
VGAVFKRVIGTLKKAISAMLLCLIAALAAVEPSYCWSNGGYSQDQLNPKYGTHDWIAEHALDWLPLEAKQWLLPNKALYLYGTELPDNGQAPDGIGDTHLHHIYFNADGGLMDASSAVRANATYRQALSYMLKGDLAPAAKYAGVMTHYISDVAVFGHVMGKATPWGEEKHHNDYENYVNSKTSSYGAEFNVYLQFDGKLEVLTAYNAAVNLAYDTTFDSSGRGLTCVWMDQNYDWSNPTFKDRVGMSLNLAVNYVADVLYTLYVEWTAQHAPTAATVRFEVNGLGADTSGTVLTVDGVGYSYSDLPKSFTWGVGSSHSFSWSSIVNSSLEGKQYVWLSTAGNLREDTITVPAGGGLVSAYFRAQYLWTFKVEGLGADVRLSQTVAMVEVEEGRVYSFIYSGLNTLASFWWDEGSTRKVGYAEYVESTVDGKRYACHNPPRLNITVTGSGTISASYHVEFRVDVAGQAGRGTTDPSPGSYWVDDGSTFKVKAAPNAGYAFDVWEGTVESADNPLTVEVHAPFHIQAAFKEAFDFAVSAVPSSVTMPKGGGLTISVKVERVRGTAETVRLSVSNLPEGAAFSIRPDCGQPPFSSMLTITASEGTPTGTYRIVVEASSGNLTRTAQVTLTVLEAERSPSSELIILATFIIVIVAAFVGIFIESRRR